MATSSGTQVFIIHRHGARYPLKKPEHNVIWPTEKSFWKSHIGRLTPVGVLQMNSLGSFFRQRYPWANVHTVKIYSTHRSRALESAWALALGLLPETPIKFDPIRLYASCTKEVCCGQDMCCIHYYHKNDDPIFGRCDPSMAYKINVNGSPLLKDYADHPEIVALVERLNKEGRFRIRRDSVTTVAKLKDIYSQLQIDAQFDLPHAGTIAGRYGLSPREIELIGEVGCEVIHRRLIPSTDQIGDDLYNQDQGMGLIGSIHNTLAQWDGTNMINVLSCHDTNLIAVMSILGIKILPPDFAGYILIERTTDQVRVCYCINPFDGLDHLQSKIWSGVDQRDKFLSWGDLPDGAFDVGDFLRILRASYCSPEAP